MNDNIRTETPCVALLADGFDPDADVHTFHGVVIENDEITNGQNGTKYWPAEELEKAAGSLTGKPVVDGHTYGPSGQPTNDAVVGKIIRDGYDPEVGWIYEMEVGETDLARKLHNGHLEVSIHGGGRRGGEHESGAAVMTDIIAADLAIVPYGGARGNSVNPGAAAAMSAAELSNRLDDVAVEIELASTHRPSFSGTTTESWSKPALEDFDTDDLSEVDDHFLASVSGFPPEDFGDLKLPVVSPGEELSLNALRSAKRFLSRTDGISQSDQERLASVIADLASEHFDADFESSLSGHDDPSQASSRDVPIVEIPHENTMSDEYTEGRAEEHIADEEAELDGDMVAVEKEELDALLSQRDKLSDVRKEKKQLESELEDAQKELDPVKELYVDALLQHTDFSEEFFTDRSVQQLREQLSHVLNLNGDRLGRSSGASAAANVALNAQINPQTRDTSPEKVQLSGIQDPDEAERLEAELSEARDKLEAAQNSNLGGGYESHYEARVEDLEEKLEGGR